MEWVISNDQMFTLTSDVISPFLSTMDSQRFVDGETSLIYCREEGFFKHEN